MENHKLSKKDLLSMLAWTLHYEGWYKESIEGKFGLKEDGADHGRFRKSKNKDLDKNFIASLKFDKDGNSVLKDKHGNPYYKMENGEFYVDSAIKGFDFLPPSWKQENVESAELLLQQIQHCIQNKLDMGKFSKSIANIIHKNWVARQIANQSNGQLTTEQALILGTLNENDLKNDEISQKNSDLCVYLGKDNLKNIWGYENFVSFDLLTEEEKIKDYNQLLYALKVVSETNNVLSLKAKKTGYSLEEQYKKISESINDQNKEQKE